MNKFRLKEHLLALEQHSISDAEMNYQDYIASNLLDKSEIIAADEQSQHRASIEYLGSFDDRVHLHEEHLKAIQRLDFDIADEVRPGAVIKTNNRYFIVGLSKSKFEFEGNQYIGISTEAPLYSCMKGKKKGDECNFNGTNFTIQEIY
jgi:transcription elongation GreA/GreB family factor